MQASGAWTRRRDRGGRSRPIFPSCRPRLECLEHRLAPSASQPEILPAIATSDADSSATVVVYSSPSNIEVNSEPVKAVSVTQILAAEKTDRPSTSLHENQTDLQQLVREMAEALAKGKEVHAATISPLLPIQVSSTIPLYVSVIQAPTAPPPGLIGGGGAAEQGPSEANRFLNLHHGPNPQEPPSEPQMPEAQSREAPVQSSEIESAVVAEWTGLETTGSARRFQAETEALTENALQPMGSHRLSEAEQADTHGSWLARWIDQGCNQAFYLVIAFGWSSSWRRDLTLALDHNGFSEKVAPALPTIHSKRPRIRLRRRSRSPPRCAK